MNSKRRMDETMRETEKPRRGKMLAAKFLACGWALSGALVVGFCLVAPAGILGGFEYAVVWCLLLVLGAGMIWLGTRRLRILGGAAHTGSGGTVGRETGATFVLPEPSARRNGTAIPSLGQGFLVQGFLFLFVNMLTVYGDSVRSCLISFGLWDLGLLALSVIGYRSTRFDRGAILLGPVLFSTIAIFVEAGCHMHMGE